MRNFLLLILILLSVSPAFATQNSCTSEIAGYKVFKGSVYPFKAGEESACFFAFYTPNPDPEPMTDVKGNGNLGDSLWYGYYHQNNPTKIYELPKPNNERWGMVCSIDAVSFYDMNGDKKRDITVIGACDNNVINYTVPFVFIRKGNHYVLDTDVYSGIYGFIGLTVDDVRKYIKSPEKYFKILEAQNHIH